MASLIYGALMCAVQMHQWQNPDLEFFSAPCAGSFFQPALRKSSSSILPMIFLDAQSILLKW
jgi:hypothetical protein